MNCCHLDLSVPLKPSPDSHRVYSCPPRTRTSLLLLLPTASSDPSLFPLLSLSLSYSTISSHPIRDTTTIFHTDTAHTIMYLTQTQQRVPLQYVYSVCLVRGAAAFRGPFSEFVALRRRRRRRREMRKKNNSTYDDVTIQ